VIPAAREAAADVLVVDDDPTVAEVVAAYLRRTGHTVRLVADGPQAVAAARASLPDLVVLDLMLPGYDGFEVFRQVRQLGPVCVIMLTARTSEQDRILGLELGADDYVTKPFSPRELALRVRSVLRRAGRGQQPAEEDEVLRHGPLEVDLTRHEARCDARLLSLTAREFDLLAFLLAHPHQVYTRVELMRQVWGWEFGDQSTVTVHVRRLREKIEPEPAVPRYLVTVWGVGYRLDDPDRPPPTALGAPDSGEPRPQHGETA
jgi:DNA-binding response OmpR family regulator